MDLAPARRVAERAVLAALLRARWDVEELLARDEARARTFHEALGPFVAAAGIEGALEPRDEWLLGTPLGGFEREQAEDASWCIEIAAVLAWALRVVPELARDRLVPDHGVGDALLGRLRPEVARAVVAGARLRDPRELARQARETVLVRNAIVKSKVDMPDVVYAGVVDSQLAELGGAASTPEERRAAVDGLTPAMLTPTIGKLYATRLFTFEWLLGARDPFWDDEG